MLPFWPLRVQFSCSAPQYRLNILIHSPRILCVLSTRQLPVVYMLYITQCNLVKSWVCKVIKLGPKICLISFSVLCSQRRRSTLYIWVELKAIRLIILLHEFVQMMCVFITGMKNLTRISAKIGRLAFIIADRQILIKE